MPKRALHAKAKNDSKAMAGKGDAESGAAFDRIRETSFTARVVAWGIVMGSLLGLVIAVKCVVAFGGTDTPRVYTPLPSPTATATTAPLQGGGMFPDAPVRPPIVTGVQCPPDTVQITVGDGVTDTVCVRGSLADTPYSETSSITVPPLSWGSVCNSAGCTPPVFRPCREDEMGDAITGECIHVDARPTVTPRATPRPTPRDTIGGEGGTPPPTRYAR